MTYWGWDYSWWRPSSSTLKSNGVQFVCRYLSWLPNGKVIQKSEYDFLLSLGIAVVLNWEYYADDMIRGANHYADGQVHAREAERQRKAMGAPAAPIYFSADFDATPGQQAAINSYLDGVASIIGRDRVGVYGSYYVIERTLGAGKAKWGWQTYAWSGGKISAKAHLYQYQNGVMGGQADRCRSLKDNFGQITKSGVASVNGASWMSNADDFLAVLKDSRVRKALCGAVWNTDNVVKSPLGNEDNPYWFASSIIINAYKKLDATQKSAAKAAKGSVSVNVDPEALKQALTAALAEALDGLNLEVKKAA